MVTLPVMARSKCPVIQAVRREGAFLLYMSIWNYMELQFGSPILNFFLRYVFLGDGDMKEAIVEDCHGKSR